MLDNFAPRYTSEVFGHLNIYRVRSKQSTLLELQSDNGHFSPVPLSPWQRFSTAMGAAPQRGTEQPPRSTDRGLGGWSPQAAAGVKVQEVGELNLGDVLSSLHQHLQRVHSKSRAVARAGGAGAC